MLTPPSYDPTPRLPAKPTLVVAKAIERKCVPDMSVNPNDQFFSSRRGLDFVEEKLEVCIRDGFEPERRFAHFAHALAQGRDVLGAEVSVQAERHLEFVKWLGSETGDKNLVEAFEGVVVAFETGDAFLD